MSLLELLRAHVTIENGELMIAESGVPELVRAFAHERLPVREEKELLRFALFMRVRAPRVAAFIYGLLAARHEPAQLASAWRRATFETIGARATKPATRSADPRPLALRVFALR